MHSNQSDGPFVYNPHLKDLSETFYEVGSDSTSWKSSIFKFRLRKRCDLGVRSLILRLLRRETLSWYVFSLGKSSIVTGLSGIGNFLGPDAEARSTGGNFSLEPGRGLIPARRYRCQVHLRPPAAGATCCTRASSGHRDRTTSRGCI